MTLRICIPAYVQTITLGLNCSYPDNTLTQVELIYSNLTCDIHNPEKLSPTHTHIFIARRCALHVRNSNIYRHYHLLELSQKLPPCQNWILARPLWWVQNRRSYLRIQISWQDDTEASLMKVSIVAACEGLTSHKKAQIWFAPLCFKSPWRLEANLSNWDQGDRSKMRIIWRIIEWNRAFR